MHFDASFFVAIGFVLFFMLLGYMGIHQKLGGMLDARGEQVAKDLAEAKRLREEAEALLESYKGKAAEAEQEAASILATAKEEAEALAEDAAKRMDEFVARRTKQAQDKIAMAETQATNDVRTAAAEAAVSAAENVLRAQIKGDAGADLVTKGISELQGKLH